MRRATLAAVWFLAACCGKPGIAAAVPVDIVNASRATRCAEEDNVYVKLLAAGIASFRLSAEHPPYIAALATCRETRSSASRRAK